MKKLILNSALVIFCILTLNVNAQTPVFRVFDKKTQVGFNSSTYIGEYLTFGKSTGTPNNGNWSIEHWDGGLNFWRPWPTTNSGNYRFFISDVFLQTGVNMKPQNVNSTNYQINGNNALQVRGFVQSHGYWTWSDSTLKRNISNLESGLTKILSLNPVKYFYKENNAITGVPSTSEDESKNQTLAQSSNNPVDNNPNSLRYGLLAQEVQTILPNLVQDNGNQKSVNYLEIIPLLIKSTQEQQAIIESMKQKIADLEGKTVYTDVDKTKLYQNNPNPFRGSTTFTYFIDEATSVSSAIIEIY
ncbi:MAG: tail fiber domain-containing protein [Chitinophagaceae bacterium]|nr:tail fiber domain-containing protein [Chitinophagaceae bacterium]